MNRDFGIYALHLGFWTSFGVTKMLRAKSASAPATTSPTAATPIIAPYSRAILAFHTLALGVMYFGLGNAVIPNRVPQWFAGQQMVGAAIIAAGAALACWALLYFRSWRFRAQLDAGHTLATGGPFAWLRHPIYGGLNLLAIGSAVWVPTPMLWAAVALMAVGGDLRGRAEERILLQAFGSEYEQYQQRTRRFLPGLY